MKRNFVETMTAQGFQKIYKNSAVKVLTEAHGVFWNGIIRSPSPIRSLVRYNEQGTIKEKRFPNQRLVLVKTEPKADIEAGE